MEGFGYACAVALGAVFVGAGAAKAARPAETAAGFRALGLPAPPALARLVPLSELGAAAILLAAPRAGGAAALLLLGGFSVFLGRALRRGLTAPCNCFGAVRAEAVSTLDLVRNLGLAALAAAALLAGRPVVPSVPAAAVAVAAVGAGVLVLRAVRARVTRRSWRRSLGSEAQG